MEFQKLQGMKYADLQKLAKVCGVRANMKVWIPILKVPRSSLQGPISRTDLSLGRFHERT